MNRPKSQPYGLPTPRQVRPVRRILVTTPLKRCSQCGQEFPATTEYFTRDRGNKDGLRPWCKTCYRQKQKDWRHTDPGRYAEYQRRQYRKDPEAWKERVKIWQQSPEGLLSKRGYYQRHRARLSEYGRHYYRQNRAKKLRAASAWMQSNPDKRKAIVQRRQARKANCPHDFTDQDWQFALAYFGDCCAACGRPPGLFHTLAADHWLPLAREDCPGTIPGNIVPLCHGTDGCNNTKLHRDPDEWLISRFGKRQAQVISQKVQRFFSQVRRAK